MAYKTITITHEAITITRHSIICDNCSKHLTDDNDVNWSLNMDDTDFADSDIDWHRYKQPDSNPKHLCPEYAKKETIT